jgi:hypothetical protein
MPRNEIDVTRATAHLPGLDIEIIHRQSPDGRSEQVSINLTAAPSFEAFANSMATFNPFVFWTEAMRLAWLPWVEATRAMMMAESRSPSLPKARPERPPPYDVLIRETD